MENRKQRLIDLLRKQSLIIAKSGESFTLASGKTSNYYVDVRKTSLTAEGHHLIGNLLYQVVASTFGITEVDAVAGVAIGGCPLASGASYASFLASRTPFDALYVRKEAKEYGTYNLIEGNFKDNMNIVLVEDVVTTGKSALRAVNAITVAGGNVLGTIAVVDRDEGATAYFESVGRKLTSLINVKDLLK
jgi:orotate phosphoribosyltransferase